MIAGTKKKVAGFTLIELLVTIALVIVMATIAVPNFKSLIERNRLSSDFNIILSSLNYARSEAVKRRENVTVQVSGAWQVLVQTEASGSVTTLRQVSSNDGSVSVSPDPFEVTFNALGRSPNCKSATPCDLSIIYNESEALNVNAAGNISRP
ncbi:GspH/FimT family pseudopilin [Halomonas ventosae]|uniref:GspH/FimT family pseudopilin n=1 Tax=Halomonas ventosae TaxID=229007 RepID=UPI00105E97D7|nr:GspH/FimT family pseudopilin [Halomonas ventosae]